MIELDGRPVAVDDLAALALYNYGHFTSMLVAEGRVRGLSLHLRRLVEDCRLLFDAELNTDTVRELIRRTCDDSPRVVRVTVYAPGLDIGHPGADAEPHVLVVARPAALYGPAPLRVRSATYLRDLPAVKHVGLFETVRQRRLAQRDGFDDALFVDDRARLLEGATWNIGFHDGHRLVWPAAEQLPGVTMQLLASLDGVESTTAELDLAAVTALPVAFATNAVVGVRPISSIDDVRYDGAADILRELSDSYLAIEGETL